MVYHESRIVIYQSLFKHSVEYKDGALDDARLMITSHGTDKNITTTIRRRREMVAAAIGRVGIGLQELKTLLGLAWSSGSCIIGSQRLLRKFLKINWGS